MVIVHRLISDQIEAVFILVGTHSRSHNYLSHVIVESFKPLEHGQPFDCSSILDTIAKELAKDLNLLPSEVIMWKA
jgi:hypothetical protein